MLPHQRARQGSIFDSLISELDDGLRVLQMDQPSSTSQPSVLASTARDNPCQDQQQQNGNQPQPLTTPPPSPNSVHSSVNAAGGSPRRGSANSANSANLDASHASTTSSFSTNSHSSHLSSVAHNSPMSPISPADVSPYSNMRILTQPTPAPATFEEDDHAGLSRLNVTYRDVMSSNRVIFSGPLFKLDARSTSTWKRLQFVLVSDTLSACFYHPSRRATGVDRAPVLLAFQSAIEGSPCVVSMELGGSSALSIESMTGSNGTDASIITVGHHPSGG
ncbi:hypothetical protein HK101_003319, partial [Irineochytrium annulatum]